MTPARCARISGKTCLHVMIAAQVNGSDVVECSLGDLDSGRVVQLRRRQD
jgi:hypothetical protein